MESEQYLIECDDAYSPALSSLPVDGMYDPYKGTARPTARSRRSLFGIHTRITPSMGSIAVHDSIDIAFHSGRLPCSPYGGHSDSSLLLWLAGYSLRTTHAIPRSLLESVPGPRTWAGDIPCRCNTVMCPLIDSWHCRFTLLVPVNA